MEGPRRVNYSASPIALGYRIVNVPSDREIVVIADSDTFEVLGRTPLEEDTRATPAVADSRLVFYSTGHLWALPIGQPVP